MIIAMTRAVGPALACCELTHLAREPIDVARAVAQHESYERLLVSLGARVVRAAAAPDLPDAVFIEDTAVVLDEIAVITRPGAESRRAETAAVAEALAPHRPLRTMTAPGTLDGGDVLQLGRTLYVGLTAKGRTDAAGIEQLEAFVAPHGYAVVAVPFSGCLHLKSAASALADDLVLLNPDWVSAASFRGARAVTVDPDEPCAANALRIGDALVHPAQYPRTRARLEGESLRVAPLAYDELAKAEGALTCCSLIFEARQIAAGR